MQPWGHTGHAAARAVQAECVGGDGRGAMVGCVGHDLGYEVLAVIHNKDTTAVKLDVVTLLLRLEEVK